MTWLIPESRLTMWVKTKVGQRKKVRDSVLGEQTHQCNFGHFLWQLAPVWCSQKGTTGSPHLRLHWAGHWVFGGWAVSEFSVHNMQWGYQTQVVQTQAHAAHFAASTRIQISPQGGALPSWIRSLGCFMLCWCCVDVVLCCFDPPHFDPFKVGSSQGLAVLDLLLAKWRPAVDQQAKLILCLQNPSKSEKILQVES